MSQSLKFGHNPRINPRSLLRQARNLNTYAHGIRLFKDINPHRIDLSDFFHVDDVNPAADHRIKPKPCHRKLGLDVEDCLFTLCVNVSGEKLPGKMQHIAGADGMAVVSVVFLRILL